MGEKLILKEQWSEFQQKAEIKMNPVTRAQMTRILKSPPREAVVPGTGSDLSS